MKILLSFDDGTVEDLKVIELLNKYNLRGLFFIPIESWGYENLDKYEGHEIGSHTITHPADMKLLDKKQRLKEVATSKILLEERLGHKVESFCYPKGKYDENTVEEVRKAGYEWARTTVVGTIEPAEDPYRTNTSVHIYPRAEYDDIHWFDYGVNLLNQARNKKNSVFHLWGHGWELNKFNYWNAFERLLNEITHS